FTWIWDAQVHPILATSNSSSPSWQGGSPGQYYDHLCIPFFAYGKGYSINTSQLTTALAAIPRPGATAGEKLLTSDQISGTTGIANLKSDLAAFVITGVDGVKRLDVQGMNAYLIAQFALLSTTDGTPPSPADASSVAAAAQTVNTQSITDVLNNQIKPEVF